MRKGSSFDRRWTMVKRVLFVDDDQSLLFLYRRVFTRMGYETFTAPSAEGALEVIQDQELDAVVVDVRLGGEKDGLDLLARIQERRRIPSIINTAYASYRRTFLSWAADTYVVKSSDLTELAEALHRLVAPTVPVEEGVPVEGVIAAVGAPPG
jgi:DNA-binding NtrC family response regulator